MSTGEVAHRLRRALAQRLEHARLTLGWSPGQTCCLQADLPLFGGGSDDDGKALADRWNALFCLDLAAVNGLMAGRIPMFGQVFDIGVDVDWHRDPKTGRRAPRSYGLGIDYRRPEVVGDIKVLWEISRHQHLVPLAVAYVATGEIRYRTAVTRQIDSWIRANPYGTGVHWCSAIEVGLRAVAWSMVHSLLSLRDAGGLLSCSEDRQALVRALYQHGYFIERNLSRFSSANNHLVGELVGLLCMATVFDFGPCSARWVSLSRIELEREIQLQVWPDGVAREQAIQYQLELLDYFSFAGCLAARFGVPMPDVYRERLRAMHRFLRALAPAEGELPQIGDSDEAVVNRFDASADMAPEGEILSMVEYLLESRPEAPPPSERAFWYARIAWLGRQQVPEDDMGHGGRSACDPAVVEFPDGGYVIVRKGNLHAVFDAGPLGYLSIAAHGHADALSFCAARRGAWWLVDPGTYAYHGDPVFRPYFRGTAAHNTAMVDGEDQSVQGGAFMWLTHAPSRLLGRGTADGVSWVEGEHAGYRRLGVVHQRRLEVEDSAFRIRDRFRSSSSRVRRIDLNLHFHPDVRLQLDGGACAATRHGASERLEIRLSPDWEWHSFFGSESPLAGWYSRGLGHKEPCFTLRGSRVVAGDLEVTTDFRFVPIGGD